MAGTPITTPVGRLVRGSLYKGNTTDAENKPLVVKSGPNMGQPRVDYFFALAIQKGPERHWSETPWGQIILQVGATAFPQAYQSPAFAWKVTDGDSQVPNKRDRKPCDNEGYKGHWVLALSSGFAPRLYRLQDGTRDQYIPYQDVDAIKLGHFVQVQMMCDGNGSQSQPGVYLNHSMVCFSGFGTEIVVGPDVASAGFGQAPLPAGASMTPPAGFSPAMVPGGAPALGAPAPLLAGFPAAPGAAAPLLAPVAAPAPPVMAPAPAGLVPVPGAAYTIEACRAGGWSDDQIVAQGMATRAPAAAPMPPPLAPGFSAPVLGAPAALIAPAGLVPNPGFVQPPVPPAGPQLTPAGAALGTMAQFVAQGWTPEAMRASGYLV